jgi:broad specificity phosphatase PhoE
VTLTHLIVVRHGESEGNVAREVALAEQAEVIPIGLRDPDVPLTARGREQAVAVGRWLAIEAEAPAAVWSSPYVRARQTAELALAEARRTEPIRLDERLRDRELGVLDRLTKPGIERRFPAEAQRRRWLGKLYYRPPGGESWADVALRLRSFLLDLDRQPAAGPVLVFAHDAVIMLLRYVLEDLTEDALLDFARTHVVGNGSITRLLRDPAGQWSAAEFDDQRHLEAAGTTPTRHEGATDDARR